MLGAIIGDIVGSPYEFNNTNDYDFPLLGSSSSPTDDSYMTIAVAKALMDTYGQDDDIIEAEIVKDMQEIGRKYPYAGYGGTFGEWLYEEDPEPYNSFGNGSAMRVASAGWMYDTLDETLHMAKVTAEVTHNHSEGIKGAQAVAAGIFLARNGSDKKDIKEYITDTFDYDLSRTLNEIRPDYSFYEICQKSVPEAIIAFLEGNDYEDVIRKAVSLGGDSDTIACMAGSIAEAFFGVPDLLKKEAMLRLEAPLQDIINEFYDFVERRNA